MSEGVKSTPEPYLLLGIARMALAYCMIDCNNNISVMYTSVKQIP